MDGLTIFIIVIIIGMIADVKLGSLLLIGLILWLLFGK